MPAAIALALLALLALLAVASAETNAANAKDKCPISYSFPRGSSPLFGGLMDKGLQCKLSNGKSCPQRNPKAVDACTQDPNVARFGVCDEAQRAAGLKLARQLYSGAPLKASPCELYSYLRGRTLWLTGDSHSKQLYKALQCALIDFWDGNECKVTKDDALMQQLDTLPVQRGNSRCFHLIGNGRVCITHAVLGTSLLDNSQVANGGVLNTLRDKGLAKPADIFLLQFGVWHAKGGEPGVQQHRAALQALGQDYSRTKGKWPHVIWRESPMTHDKDKTMTKCLPAATGWGFDNVNGRLTLSENARSTRAALLARGGTLNAAARESLPAYGVPIMKGYDYSVPLHAAHVGLRGSKELDCLHYCHQGLPEILVYELLRTLKSGVTGVKPLPPVAPERRLACTPLK
ncbi:MAG: hypothetical protein J3K34DRAFT_520821 [Monoraphidium minutum]|nr:MAG: hypothetical protein J3K34DRAFT_520821 [Monoraphidium minutum]